MMFLLLWLLTSPASAGQKQQKDQAGDIYEISSRYKTSSESGGGSTGSSSGRTILIERVLEVREDGLKLEYDLPKPEKEKKHGAYWKFPAQIFRHHVGEPELLNGDEMEARIDSWLESAGWTREVCGRWIFTWNAFLIGCDPQAALRMAESYNLRQKNIEPGADYKDSHAIESALLGVKTASSDGTVYIVEMRIDPEIFLREQAASDVILAEITGEPVTLEDALLARSTDRYSGTITITFDTDSSGRIVRKTRVTRLQIERAGGKLEKSTATTILERRLISSAATDQ
ncbi:MAG: hypothetical protein V3V15_05335 [Sphingorhabdus sp.]